MTFCCDEGVTDGEVQEAIVEWSSKRVHRVMTYTLGCEGSALKVAEDRATIAGVVLAEMMDVLPRTGHWGKVLKRVECFSEITFRYAKQGWCTFY